MLSVLIPSYRRPSLLRKALASVVDNSRLISEIIVLSPQIDEEYRTICKERAALLVNDKSRSDGRRVRSLWQVLNIGIELAAGPYVCWLNDDCTVVPGWDAAAVATFTKPDCAIVSLRTMHLGENDGFIVQRTLYHTVCANYGVMLKSFGIRFDERFSWFHGDADIALQAEFLFGKRVYGTEAACVIHEHHRDEVRTSNEEDPRSREDWVYLRTKWAGHCRVGSLRLSGLPAKLVNGTRDLISLVRRARRKVLRKTGLIA